MIYSWPALDSNDKISKTRIHTMMCCHGVSYHGTMMKVYRKALGIVALTLFAGQLQAQVRLKGQLDANAGVGYATPWGGGVKMEIYTPKLDIKPFFGIKGVTRHSSDEEVSMDYRYTGIMPLSSPTSQGYHFTSEYQGHRQGTEMEYGVELKYTLPTAGLDQITASFKGNNSKLSQDGFSQEALHSNTGAFISSGNWHINNPLLHQNDMEVKAQYHHHSYSKPQRTFNLNYGYQRISGDEERNLEAIQLMNYSQFGKSQYLADATTQRHNVRAQWNLADFGWGVRYENQLIQSDDFQELFNMGVSDDTWYSKKNENHFTHDYHTAGVFAKYSWTNHAGFFVSAGMEYDYTRMGEKNLHDYVPSANIEWQPTGRSSFILGYNRRLIRPTLSYLNPFNVRGAYTLDYGNPDLVGTHVNLFNLTYRLNTGAVELTTTLQHIRANDGFCAIWMERDYPLEGRYGIRESTWKNEGMRRAWSLTPELKWQATDKTTLQARANVIWDKRVAEAIHMAKEHWGYTVGLGLNQVLPADIRLKLHCDYSEGNTLDLYSHAGRMLSYGGELQCPVTRSKQLMVTLSYNHLDEPKVILTQGGWIGTLNQRARHENMGAISLSYKF